MSLQRSGGEEPGTGRAESGFVYINLFRVCVFVWCVRSEKDSLQVLKDRRRDLGQASANRSHRVLFLPQLLHRAEESLPLYKQGKQTPTPLRLTFRQSPKPSA